MRLRITSWLWLCLAHPAGPDVEMTPCMALEDAWS
jgi:hypothetical protein